MADAEHENAATPLMSDNDLERSSVPDSFEYVVYESSESESVTLSGSMVNDQPSPDHYGKHGLFKDEEGVMSDIETFSQHEKAALLGKTGYQDDNTPKDQADQGEGDPRYVRRRCFGRGRRCQASMQCDKKRRVRRRIILFLKATLMFGFLSFFIAKMCLPHKKIGGLLPFKEKHLLEDAESSRELIIKHGSHHISGQYPLYDLLALKTTSGDISVVVEPQPAHPDHPDEPARLFVKSLSGSVSVTFLQYPLDASSNDEDATSASHTKRQIPYRPYEVEIHTESGSINADIIFTSSAHLESRSGAISASLTPVISPDNDNIDSIQLVTKSFSSVQSISVTEPLIIKDSSYDEEGILFSRSTTSLHSSKSGSINVEYPHSWAGNVTACSSSGPVVLGGESLEITESHRGHVKGVKYPYEDQKQKEWWGSRGDMDVLLKATGPILFHVRDY